MNLDREDWKMIRLGAIYIVVAGIFTAAILALAGCGGSAASGTTASPPTAAAVARHLGCTGITQTDPVSDFAADEVDATCQGHHADIATFKTDQARDEWTAFVRQTGGTAQTGELYAVGTGY